MFPHLWPIKQRPCIRQFKLSVGLTNPSYLEGRDREGHDSTWQKVNKTSSQSISQVVVSHTCGLQDPGARLALGKKQDPKTLPLKKKKKKKGEGGSWGCALSDRASA
jgi:hypothetical protein